MKSVYLVLDMQNDLISEDAPAGKSSLGAELRGRNILERTGAAIAEARAADVAIGFVRVGFSANYAECPDRSPVFAPAKANKLFRVGTPSAEID